MLCSRELKIVSSTQNIFRFLQCVLNLASREECSGSSILTQSEGTQASNGATHNEVVLICLDKTESVVVDHCSIECSDRPTSVRMDLYSKRVQKAYKCKLFLTLSIQATPCNLAVTSFVEFAPVVAIHSCNFCSKIYGLATFMYEGCGPT